jgi:hypothetical protein
MIYSDTSFNKKNILITGGDDFIGGNLALYFQSNLPGSNIVVFDTFKSDVVIKNIIWQFPFKNIEEAINKANRYSLLGIEKLQERKIVGSVFKAFLHGLWAFLKYYIYKLVFLDGGAGFVIAFGNFEGTFYRYLKLTEAKANWQAPNIQKIYKLNS